MIFFNSNKEKLEAYLDRNPPEEEHSRFDRLANSRITTTIVFVVVVGGLLFTSHCM